MNFRKSTLVKIKLIEEESARMLFIGDNHSQPENARLNFIHTLPEISYDIERCILRIMQIYYIIYYEKIVLSTSNDINSVI